jgi:hypothetical protein
MCVLSWPELDLRVSTGGDVVLDMKLVKSELDGLPLSHPAVRAFVEELLRGGLAGLVAWAEQELEMGG